MARITSMSVGLDMDAGQFDTELKNVVDDAKGAKDEIERSESRGGGGGADMLGGLATRAAAIGVASFVFDQLRGEIEWTIQAMTDLVDEADKMGVELETLTGGRVSNEFGEAFKGAKEDLSILSRETKIWVTQLAEAAGLMIHFAALREIRRMFVSDEEIANIERLRQINMELTANTKEMEQLNKRILRDQERRREQAEQNAAFARIERQESEQLQRINDALRGTLEDISDQEFEAREARRRRADLATKTQKQIDIESRQRRQEREESQGFDELRRLARAGAAAARQDVRDASKEEKDSWKSTKAIEDYAKQQTELDQERNQLLREQRDRRPANWEMSRGVQ